MKKVWIFTFIIVLISVISVFFFLNRRKESGNEVARITLIGDSVLELQKFPYQEPGYEAWDPEVGVITSQVNVIENINYKKAGTYEIRYEVMNQRGEKIQAVRYVVLKNAVEYVYEKSYENISNKRNNWWSNNKKNGLRPNGGYSLESFKKYHATFLGLDEKVIYLTFDEGSNETFVNEIVDVLNQNEVKSTFFFCKNFILDNKETMKKIVDGGHSVGNHTANHVDMSLYANEMGYDRFVREIKVVEDAFYQTTGVSMDKVYREPKGEWSERSLKMVADMGYKSFFWSASYLDFDGELSKESALQHMLELYHNGAIYLIHPNNKGNYLALDDFIKEMKIKGYRFDLVKNISI